MATHKYLISLSILSLCLLSFCTAKGRLSIEPSLVDQPSQISNYFYVSSIDEFEGLRSSSDYLMILFYRNELESNLIESIKKANKLLRKFLIKVNFAVFELDRLGVDSKNGFSLLQYDPRFKDLEFGFYLLSRYNTKKLLQFMGHIDGKVLVQFIHSHIEEDLGNVDLPYLEKLHHTLVFNKPSILLLVCDSIASRKKEIELVLANPRFDYILVSQDVQIRQKYGITGEVAGVVFRLNEYDLADDDNPKGFYLALDKYEKIDLDRSHLTSKSAIMDILAIYEQEPLRALQQNEQDVIPGFPRLLVIVDHLDKELETVLTRIANKHRHTLSVRTAREIPEHLRTQVSQSELPLYLLTISKKLLLKKSLSRAGANTLEESIDEYLAKNRETLLTEGPSQPLSLLGIDHITKNLENELLSHQETILLICSERYIACRKAMLLVQYVKKKILETKIRFAYVDPFITPVEFKKVSHLPAIMHLRHPKEFRVDSIRRLFRHEIGVDSDEALNIEAVMDLLDSSQYEDKLNPRLLANEYQVYQYFRNFPVRYLDFDLNRREYEEFDREELRYFEDLKGKLHERDIISDTIQKEEF